MKIISAWLQRYFADPQAVMLLLLLLIVTAIILVLGQMLAPVLAGIVIAFLLEGPVQFLRRCGMPRLPAVCIVFALSCVFTLLLLVGTLPRLSSQLVQLVQNAPAMVQKGYTHLESLPATYPELVSESQVVQLTAAIDTQISSLSQKVLDWSVASVVGVLTLIVYLVLVPLLVFFFLKDKERLLVWIRGLLPDDRTLMQQIWREVDLQLGNYVRGKFWQVLIVWGVSFTVFAYMNLQYAMLLSFIVGLSVLVPYVGPATAALPVAIVAYFQWGWNPEFAWVLLAYGVIQFLDGNLLVFLLFSEVNDLHPIAIIVAVLLFGGLWGFWGVFFAIPLATVIKAILTAWPQRAGILPEPGDHALPPPSPLSQDIRGELGQS